MSIKTGNELVSHIVTVIADKDLNVRLPATAPTSTANREPHKIDLSQSSTIRLSQGDLNSTSIRVFSGGNSISARFFRDKLAREQNRSDSATPARPDNRNQAQIGSDSKESVKVN